MSARSLKDRQRVKTACSCSTAISGGRAVFRGHTVADFAESFAVFFGSEDSITGGYYPKRYQNGRENVIRSGIIY